MMLDAGSQARVETLVLDRQAARGAEVAAKSTRLELDQAIKTEFRAAGATSHVTNAGFRVVVQECQGRITANIAALQRDRLHEYLVRGKPYSAVNVRRVA